MSGTTEPLAAILAEMRGRILGEDRIKYTLPADEALAFADRIEAAAERERDAVKFSAGMSCELCERLGPARFGNAAAMRAAIQRLLSLCDKSLCKIPISLPLAQGNEAEYAKLEAEGKAAMDGLRAALAAPARNCDVIEDQNAAAWAYVEFVRKLRYKAEGIRMNWTVEIDGGLLGWLYGTAENEKGKTE